MTTATRPTAIGDHPVHSVIWKKVDGSWTRVHGVAGRTRRVTLCSLDFIHVAHPYTDEPITCRVCLARLGQPYEE